MPDYPVMFLIYARKEARYILKGEYRNVESIAESYKAGSLCRGINIQDSCKYFWLVGDYTDGFPFESGKSGYQVRCI